MSTLADLRSALRVLLNDAAAGGYLWNDGQLNRHINDAIKAMSVELPREASAEVVTVAGQEGYALPAGVLRLVRVYDREAETILVPGGDSFGIGYELFGGSLRVFPAPSVSGVTLRVDYVAYHQELTLDATISTVPAGEEELLLARAAGMAVMGLGADEAKRRRFEEGAGQAAGSAAAGYLAGYAEGVRARRRVVRSGNLVHRDTGFDW